MCREIVRVCLGTCPEPEWERAPQPGFVSKRLRGRGPISGRDAVPPSEGALPLWSAGTTDADETVPDNDVGAAHNTQTLADMNRASSSFLRLTQDTNPLVSVELELGPVHCYMAHWSIPCTLSSLPTSRPRGLGTILSLGGDRPFLHTLSCLGKASSLRVSSSQPFTPLSPLFVVFNPHSNTLTVRGH